MWTAAAMEEVSHSVPRSLHETQPCDKCLEMQATHASVGSAELVAVGPSFPLFYGVFHDLQALTALIWERTCLDSTWSTLPALPHASCATSLN